MGTLREQGGGAWYLDDLVPLPESQQAQILEKGTKTPLLAGRSTNPFNEGYIAWKMLFPPSLKIQSATQDEAN